MLADTAGAEALGVDFSSRPELAAALEGRRFQDQRRSDTLDQQILATAAPVFDGGRVVGAVRLTQSVEAVNDAVRRTAVGIATVGLVVLIAALLAAFLLARGITRPIERLGAAADRIASGDLDARAPVEGSREQRSLARSFNVMTERLARALRAQTEFVADASHQLRTPLTGLRLRIEEARASGDRADAEPPPRRRAARSSTGCRTRSTTCSCSAAPASARAKGRRSTSPRRRPTRAGAGSAPRPRARSRSPRSTTAARQRWASRADLDRAVDAVVENAIHYTPRGGHVTVRAAGAAIEVLDDGPGLADGEEDEVFARFHRGHAGRGGGAPGTGLGLPIARELMRAWGGDAALVNRPEGGTRATLTGRPFAGSFPGGP